MRDSSGRLGSNPVDESKLGVVADIEARSDFEGGILKDLSAAAAAPSHDGLIPHPQKRGNLRPKEPKHRAHPAVERLRRLDLGDRESVEHTDYIVGAVPGFAGDPAIGRKQPDRFAPAVDRNRDQMAHLLPNTML